MLRACPICLPTYLPIFCIPSEFLPASSPIQLFASDHAQSACLLSASHLKSCLPSLLFICLLKACPICLPTCLSPFCNPSEILPAFTFIHLSAS